MRQSGDKLYVLLNFDYRFNDAIILNETTFENETSDYQFYYVMANLKDELHLLGKAIERIEPYLEYKFLYPKKHFYSSEFVEVLESEPSKEIFREQLSLFSTTLKTHDNIKVNDVLYGIIDEILVTQDDEKKTDK